MLGIVRFRVGSAPHSARGSHTSRPEDGRARASLHDDLRLDTDWYESTAAELAQLYPRLSPGGVCIIDDYGYWRGARRAVDDYFTSHGVHVLLHKIDETGRICVKPGYFGARERDPRLI